MSLFWTSDWSGPFQLILIFYSYEMLLHYSTRLGRVVRLHKCLNQSYSVCASLMLAALKQWLSCGILHHICYSYVQTSGCCFCIIWLFFYFCHQLCQLPIQYTLCGLLKAMHIVAIICVMWFLVDRLLIGSQTTSFNLQLEFILVIHYN